MEAWNATRTVTGARVDVCLQFATGENLADYFTGTYLLGWSESCGDFSLSRILSLYRSEEFKFDSNTATGSIARNNIKRARGGGKLKFFRASYFSDSFFLLPRPRAFPLGRTPSLYSGKYKAALEGRSDIYTHICSINFDRRFARIIIDGGAILSRTYLLYDFL